MKMNKALEFGKVEKGVEQVEQVEIHVGYVETVGQMLNK